MIINLLSRHSKAIAWSLYFLFCAEWLSAIPSPAHPLPLPARTYAVPFVPSPASKPVPAPAATKHTYGGGPGQPEMQAFQSVNANNMVDLFTGDFSYNIPLMDVGGYPLNISYRSGISMDQEASWVGLGWNINPGTITRNLRGLPDDFSGKDSIKKINSIKENKTIGVTAGGSGDVEVAGLPINVTLGASLGVFHNNYKGWGLENGINATINSAQGSKGGLTGGLGLSAENNSQDGLTLTPSLSLELSQRNADDNASLTNSFSVALPYNSRSGLKGLQLSIGQRLTRTDLANQSGNNNTYTSSSTFTSTISFASTAYTPTITMPLTTRQYSFTAKLGLAQYTFHPSVYLSGYISKQSIDPSDTLLALPAYGYLHYQDGAGNKSALLDFNREKELVYRENPVMPHIAVPLYTYDAFSITGEGTGGMFRAYRGDVGYIYDHLIRTKDLSDKASVDLGYSNLVHGGLDLNFTRAFTQNSAWTDQNSLGRVMGFKKDSGLFQAAYFRNPGEKSINSKKFYDGLGGDDVVTAKLYQAGTSSSVIQATNYLTLYRNKRPIADSLMTPQKAFKQERDKRTQVISYLNAQEADVAGLSRYIENYTPNVFTLATCSPAKENDEGDAIGLVGEYFTNNKLNGDPVYVKLYDTIGFNWGGGFPDIPMPPPLPGHQQEHFPVDNFAIRWTGRLKAPVTGRYVFHTTPDDGVRFWLNDSLLIQNYLPQTLGKDTVYLVAGEMYPLKMEYYENGGNAKIDLQWSYPGQSTYVNVPRHYLYPPAVDTFDVNGYLVKEKRINSFRKANHISEIDVLNNDGRRYVYGIPVYNLRQKETTFSVAHSKGNAATGIVGYIPGFDNTAHNQQGKDNYYTSEEIPAYAHSFLLTGLLSPDYVDLTGNGISDDDKGDAVRFNYSKICGIGHAYRWRAPYSINNATYNEGLKTDSRDDKGNYVYGEKELWYLHSIVSRTMIATFVTENRADLFAIDENGNRIPDSSAKRLKEINLYSKADFIKNGTSAIPIKTVHFDYAYELCRGLNKEVGLNNNDSGKLTLKRIWFTYNGNDKGKQNPYVFNYNALNPAYNIKSYDRWGNYKDPSQNPSATGVLTNAEYPYALQDSALAAQNAAAWSLDSIYLPSGGAIKVSFESDDYAYVQHRRAMDLFKLAGLGPDTLIGHSSPQLYTSKGDHLFVFVNIPRAVGSKADLKEKYLSGVSKLYFKLFVRMPDDQYGSGYEYISCYADLDQGDSYGIVNSGMIWLRISGISLAGDKDGDYSPLAKAAIQFLRLNLPSKAYPGSEVGDDIDLENAVKIINGLADNIKTAFSSFDRTARGKSWCMDVDLNRTFVRLDNPFYKKYGGGHRVKRITIYDKWDKMAPHSGQRAAVYGQEYTYTTQQEIGGVMTTVSSGVASYEPGIGGEENPFRQPIEYVEKIAPLGPVTLGYSEEPLGESIFPAAGIGYSKVRVRTINYKNRKSANGYEETTFYTAYDFPTYTDRTIFDNDTKKRFKPGLANFLKINARHYLTFSQGFKVELNDMHGKMRSQAFYPETDPKNYTSYTENVYKVEDPKADEKKLSNIVSVMHPDGTIDTAACIGKDVELMMDMREQLSITNGYNLSPNTDMFPIPALPPVFILPTLISLPQREEDRFRSVATLKVIQRYGILDSVIHVDKGSKVSTKDLLYDSETGDVLLTRTQNEFNDPVYSFSYPAHWAYDGMGPAYKNINLLLPHVTIKSGKMISSTPGADADFSSGDEILVAGRMQTGTSACDPVPATFPGYTKIWAIDSSVVRGGPRALYFIDADGQPYNGNDATLKVIRSGRRNMNTQVGSVTTLRNPLVHDGVSGGYKLSLDSSTRVVNAGAAEFGQLWKVEDRRGHRTSVNCVDTIPADCSGGGPSCSCVCLKNLFSYLIASRRLFIRPSDGITVSSLVQSANSAGYPVTVDDCPVLKANQYKTFYALTKDSLTSFYAARIGDFLVTWDLSKYANLYHFYADDCGSERVVSWRDTADMSTSTDTVHKNFSMTKSMESIYLSDLDPSNTAINSPLPFNEIYTDVGVICSAGKGAGIGKGRHEIVDIYTLVKFDSASNIPAHSTVLNATLQLQRFPLGFRIPTYPNSHTVQDAPFWVAVPPTDWDYSYDGRMGLGGLPGQQAYYTTSVTQASLTLDIKDQVQRWVDNGNYGLAFYSAEPDTLMYSNWISPSLDVTYALPADSITSYMLLYYKPFCDTITDYSCRSVVADTTFNPYTAGVLGNWRGNRSYTYFGARAETDPSGPTNIRHNGAFHDFAPFWAFQNSKLRQQPDTTRWVWNSELTLFNPKGMEIENKDPLGRYNSIQYGYYKTLPVAVTQNGHYRESAFEGFEDYGFLTQVCDTACPADRFIDFSPYVNKITTAEKHSGKSSLRLDGHDQVGLAFNLVDQEAAQPSLNFNTSVDACSGIGTVLDAVKIPNTILLPTFSPFKGRKMVVSAWVKEEQSCACTSYVHNDIKIVFDGSQSLTFMPTGPIIEGWQRYEGIFTIPAGAGTISVNLEATDSTTVFFDDLRLHPFNANMKSFVYNPTNLRLMAEQDENNYSTFYEYDDDGTLIRVKKETERGIQTIKETRSALLKQ